jgi:hypothetical protein
MSCQGTVTALKEIQSDKTESLHLHFSVLHIIALIKSYWLNLNFLHVHKLPDISTLQRHADFRRVTEKVLIYHKV